MLTYRAVVTVVVLSLIALLPNSARAQPCDAGMLAGDANGDCVVNPLDSGFVLARFGYPVGTGDPSCDAADVNLNGEVDPLDAGFVLARFCGDAGALPLVAVDPPDSPTSETQVTLIGTTVGASSLEIAGGVELIIAPMAGCYS